MLTSVPSPSSRSTSSSASSSVNPLTEAGAARPEAGTVAVESSPSAAHLFKPDRAPHATTDFSAPTVAEPGAAEQMAAAQRSKFERTRLEPRSRTVFTPAAHPDAFNATEHPLTWAIARRLHSSIRDLPLDAGSQPLRRLRDRVVLQFGVAPATWGMNELVPLQARLVRLANRHPGAIDCPMDGSTLLHRAAGINAAITGTLAAAGADLSRTNPEGDQALHVAVKSGNPQTVWALVSRGASMQAHGADGMPAMNLAVHLGDTGVVGILIEDGRIEEFDQTDAQGRGLVANAAAAGHLPILTMLMRTGVRFDLRDNNNQTPEEIARANGHHKVADMIRDTLTQWTALVAERSAPADRLVTHF